MKMNYLRRSNQNKKFRKPIYIVGSIIVLLIIAPYIMGVFEVPKRFLFGVTSPLWENASKIENETGGFFGLFKSKRKLIEENNKLKNEIENFKQTKLSYELAITENEVLKDKLGRRSTDGNKVLAAILIRPSKTPYDTILVDAGANSGVSAGDIVIGGKNIALGSVVEVLPNQSRVILYSSAGEETDASVGNENISVTAIGRGGGNYEFSLPREIAISEGDVISIPRVRSLVLGVVSRIYSDPAEAFKKILFKTPINIQQTKLVEILIN